MEESAKIFLSLSAEFTAKSWFRIFIVQRHALKDKVWCPESPCGVCKTTVYETKSPLCVDGTFDMK